MNDEPTAPAPEVTGIDIQKLIQRLLNNPPNSIDNLDAVAMLLRFHPAAAPKTEEPVACPICNAPCVRTGEGEVSGFAYDYAHPPADQ